VGDFDGGKREGKWIFWYTDGIRQLDAQYSGGKAIGFWTLYFEDGSKCAEGEYVDGEISGHWTVWDEFGAVNPERTGFYENGQKISE
jgi:antitoxin component YwqK of YwqJK toxin-antitoxin module